MLTIPAGPFNRGRRLQSELDKRGNCGKSWYAVCCKKPWGNPGRRFATNRRTLILAGCDLADPLLEGSQVMSERQTIDGDFTVHDGETGEVLESEQGPVFVHRSRRRGNLKASLLATITLNLIGAGGALAVQEGARVRVARIWGLGRAVEMVPAMPGDPKSKMLPVLTGSFAALNCVTGELYEAPKLALPDAYQTMLVEELERAKPGPIGFDVEIVAMPTGGTAKYRYIARCEFRDENRVHPLAELEDHFGIGEFLSGAAAPMIPLKSDRQKDLKTIAASVDPLR